MLHLATFVKVINRLVTWRCGKTHERIELVGLLKGVEQRWSSDYSDLVLTSPSGGGELDKLFDESCGGDPEEKSVVEPLALSKGL